LSLVYVVFAIHIIHWKLTGQTLAPLELNEVMYTLELGIITAGFLFMCLLVLGTLIGRFFCSWACHIMVWVELCAWCSRIGILAKPIRSGSSYGFASDGGLHVRLAADRSSVGEPPL
jgi:polyferredoxin